MKHKRTAILICLKNLHKKFQTPFFIFSGLFLHEKLM